MHLYSLLKDRASINILRILYDNEVVDKKSHTMTHSEVKAKLTVSEMVDTLAKLQEVLLIASETNNGGERILSLTQKGKEFVEQFDKLRLVLDGKKQQQKAYEVKYGLTAMEQRILLMCAKIKSETRQLVPLQTLTQEVYPYQDVSKKSGSVSKYAKKLEELNLLKRVKMNNRMMLDVTESGERVIKEQFLNGALVAKA
jgi:predicted transcriptional regulator